MDDRRADEDKVIDLAASRPRGPSLGPQSAGEALRLLRYRARLSRDDLAALVGVSAGAISNYENDVSAPSAVTLRRMTTTFADLLRRDARDLWDEFGVVLDDQGQVAHP